MELVLQTELPHQQKAVDAVANVFNRITWETPEFYYQNPQFRPYNDILQANIQEIQEQNLRFEDQGRIRTDPAELQLDVKMETGTGKTYVYTQTIFELHKRYGINKFIIIVPSLPIKEGVKQFLNDDYVRRHFSNTCGYGCEIELSVLEVAKIKKGRKFLPSSVRTFVEGSYMMSNRIYVLLANMQLLTNAKILKDAEYDMDVAGFFRPFDALKATRPFVIIDEPHRFAKGQLAFQAIENELAPQCLIRYGATFPEAISGRGKNKFVVRDYCNLLYDLNACDSFNLGLIKGIAKEHFEPISTRAEKVKITSIAPRESASFQLIRKNDTTKTFTLRHGDSLSLISDVFSNLYITGIGKNIIELSNGQTKATGEEFNTDIYSSSYQKQMIRLALERHFETERENFTRQFKIKTLALFFIDDISSYRQLPKSDKKPYLREMFESLLQERIDLELSDIRTKQQPDYRDYLLASKADISRCHAGYFAQDRNETDEVIAREVHEILADKKGLLSIRDENGQYNTRRFLFSKWTLKEGWDNPNVFTIAKLRSSGSENSKLQEVGRGLRLPVDECGNRIASREFMLNYIVDFTEADFATKLINQINGEFPMLSVITDDKLREYSQKLGIGVEELFSILYQKKYINHSSAILPENREKFFAEYPDFACGLNNGVIKDRNKSQNQEVRIRSNNFDELRELWEKVNEKYLLFYERIDKENMKNELCKQLNAHNVFVLPAIQSIRDVMVVASSNKMGLESSTGVQYSTKKSLHYNNFLMNLNKQTNLTINIWHEIFVQYHHAYEKLSAEYFNDYSLGNIVKAFEDWKINSLQMRFHYRKANIQRFDTALTDSDGNVRPFIAQGLIGSRLAPGTPHAKYLYDKIAYDSPLEMDNITSDIEEVIVYGKIPRNSLAIPTITGQSYSPDFMYIVKRKNKAKELNIIVETKDVEGKSELRKQEKIRIDCAKEFFQQLSIDGYKVSFHTQLNNKQMRQIISEVLHTAEKNS